MKKAWGKIVGWFKSAKLVTQIGKLILAGVGFFRALSVAAKINDKEERNKAILKAIEDVLKAVPWDLVDSIKDLFQKGDKK